MHSLFPDWPDYHDDSDQVDPQVTVDDSQKGYAVPGNFGAIVTGDTVFLPPNIMQLADACHFSTAEELLTLLVTFRGAVEMVLEWTSEEVDEAVDRLHEQLESSLTQQHRTIIRNSDTGIINFDELMHMYSQAH